MKDLGEANYILRIKLLRDRKNKVLALSQASYIDKIVTRFGMENPKGDFYPSDMEFIFLRSNHQKLLKRKNS